jgi:PKD repeat protein
MRGKAGPYTSRIHSRILRRFALALPVVVTAIGLVAVPASPAAAVNTKQDVIVNADPVPWTPWLVDSAACSVRAIAQAGTTMIAGGNCHQARNASTSAVMTRDYIFGFDATTGQVNSTFVPKLDGMVHTLAASDDGLTVYVGGEFKKVNGVTSSYVVKLRVADGSIVSTFKVPVIDGRVYSIRIANNRLYIGGGFTHVGGQAIAYLASLDLMTGAVDPTFKATFSGINNPNPTYPTFSTKVKKVEVSPDGARMVVLGNFTTVNGTDRGQVAMFDLTTPTVQLANWQTNRFRAACKPKFESYASDVDFSPDGSYFAIVTAGGYLNNQNAGCDSNSRWETYATGSDLQPTWITFSGGDSSWALAVTGTAIYTGGHFRWQNNPFAADYAGPGAVPRPGLAALDPTNGLPLTWNPTRDLGVGVFDLLATPTGLWIGHDTNVVANEQHPKLAYFPLDGGTAVPKPSAGTLPATMHQLGRYGTPVKTVGPCGATTTPSLLDDGISSRSFDGTTSGSVVPMVNTTTAWGQARGAFMLSGVLYTGWADGSLCKSAFNGYVFGPPTVVELYNSQFKADLAKITGMFYANSRIYYVRSDASTLRWRSFTAQSDVVGATYSVASGNVTGIDFSKVGSMFVQGDQLYFVTRNDGILRRIGWALGAPVSGTAVALSGPAQNGDATWASQGTFLYVPADQVAPNQPPQASFTSNCTKLACSFSSAGSRDPDGAIQSYAWDFGDGSVSSAQSPSHTYASPNTYTVQLTVTDNSGGTATASQQLTVDNPPDPPTAKFTVNCLHLDCAFDASTSTGTYSPISSYSWDFGDGSSLGSGVTTNHPYAADGSYTITLTVTDENSLQGSTSQTVFVSQAGQSISFVGEADRNTNATSWSVQVPASVTAGDGLILSATANSNTVTLSDPSGGGWTLLGTKAIGPLVSRVWQKVADGTSAGSTVTFTGGGTMKVNVVLLAYRGTVTTGPVTAFSVAAETVSRTTHTTPTVPVSVDGSWVVSMWTDKSSTVNSLSPPPGPTQRYMGCTTSSGRICSLLTDSGPVNSGTTAGGLVATADAANSNDVMWTLVLAPPG